MKDPSFLVKDIEISFKKEYAELANSEEQKMMQVFQRFFKDERRVHDLKAILYEAAMTIHRLFPFRETSIGIRYPSDGKYRYLVALGFSPAAREAHMKLEYTHEEMFDRLKYPWIKVSDYIDFRYAEGEQFKQIGEEKSFTRPSMLSLKRDSPRQMLEGDYFDIYFTDEKGNVIGWIEVAAPKEGTIPPLRMIRWLELFALMLSPIIENELRNWKPV